MPPLLPVIPGEDERDKEADSQQDSRAANDTGRPAEVLGDEAEHLEDEPCCGHVGDRPLDDLALLHVLDERSHWASPGYLASTLRQPKLAKPDVQVCGEDLACGCGEITYRGGLPAALRGRDQERGGARCEEGRPLVEAPRYGRDCNPSGVRICYPSGCVLILAGLPVSVSRQHPSS